MVQSLKLGTGPDGAEPNIRRVNRLPIIIVIVLVVLFLAVIMFGLSTRGLYFRREPGIGVASNSGSASTYADQLKRGVSDAIIGDPSEPPAFQPAPVAKVDVPSPANPFTPQPADIGRRPPSESEEEWLARLDREQREQYLRERSRQQLARLQANDAAYDSPLAINLNKLQTSASANANNASGAVAAPRSGAALDLYAEALQAGLGGQNPDPNNQRSKEDFFNADIKSLGYLPNQVVSQRSPYELKRGSVIPATLITGINSDLPGRITAQVSQNVYDSATGHRLLIPQGAKLFGRYDSKVSFGQSRVLVVWTDIIFPNGSTLQIGGMAGTDAEGYSGFNDQVNNHYLKTFGSAVLLAVIGAGIDMAVPQSSTLATQETASDAARRNFAETFGRVAERTITKNLDVQPTLEIRPGYKFNVLVDQDIIFFDVYRG